METTRRSLLTSAMGAGAVASVAAISGSLLFAGSASAQDRRDERREERKEEHYPRIHGALDALRSAREELNSAGDDFHGRKDAAVRAVDEAIRQLQDLVQERPR